MNNLIWSSYFDSSSTLCQNLNVNKGQKAAGKKYLYTLCLIWDFWSSCLKSLVWVCTKLKHALLSLVSGGSWNEHFRVICSSYYIETRNNRDNVQLCSKESFLLQTKHLTQHHFVLVFQNIPVITCVWIGFFLTSFLIFIGKTWHLRVNTN